MLSTLPLLSIVVLSAPSQGNMWEAPTGESPRKQVQYVFGKPVILFDELDTSGAGPYMFVSEGSTDVVRRSMATSAANDSAARWHGQPVVLYSADGTRCQDVVTGVATYGWFNMTGAYEGDPQVPPPTAKTIWGLSDDHGGLRVVAELASSACQDAVFATLATDATAVAVPHAATLEQQEIAIIALAKTLVYQRIQNQFVHHAQWQAEEYEGEPRAAIQKWDAAPTFEQFAVGQRSFISVRMLADGACGEFSAAMYLVWELVARDGKQFLEQRYESTDGGNPMLLFADRVTGDMHVEYEPSFRVPTDMDDEEGCGC